MKVLICNSPPQSGKDTFVKYLAKKHENVQHLEFKEKLIKLVCEIYSITRKQWDEIYTNENKEIPSGIFTGLSPRQALIHVSEDIIKPHFGNDYFGKAASKLLKEHKLNMFSDGGFYDEILEVVKIAKPENTLLLEFKRDGCNFSKDSRGVVNIEGVTRYVFDNNGSQEQLNRFADGVYDLLQTHIPTYDELRNLELSFKEK